jgi:hypothetical protein
MIKMNESVNLNEAQHIKNKHFYFVLGHHVIPHPIIYHSYKNFHCKCDDFDASFVRARE